MRASTPNAHNVTLLLSSYRYIFKILLLIIEEQSSPTFVQHQQSMALQEYLIHPPQLIAIGQIYPMNHQYCQDDSE
jgi:hypothetical protein